MYCFNPCFYGSYSFTTVGSEFFAPEFTSFNPCFYGSYSFTPDGVTEDTEDYTVLILVFMEVILLHLSTYSEDGTHLTF